MYLLNNSINLVICQKSKISDWITHFKDYYPEYMIFDLTKKKECAAFMETTNGQVVGVINYELAFRRPFLLDLRDFTLMLDESSLISNEMAKRSKFVLKLKPESVILLSGTPTAGKYEKLWSQLRLLGWNISKWAFWNSYVTTRWVKQGFFMREEVTGYKNVEHLKQRLGEYGAVFMKTAEVMTLPEQVEQRITVKATKEYRQFMKDGYLLLDDGTELIGDNSLTKILHARQLCGQWNKDKLQAFEDLIQGSEDRFIVFYNFNLELEKLEEITRRKTDHISILNGKTKDLDAYEKWDDSITFIQYQAGAMGGNFQKANKIIYFTLPLGKGSCDLWEQSKKRIHRIGQGRTCFYYYLLVQKSFEEINLEALKRGKELTDDLFNG